jgi:hypothetical protein
VIVTEPKAGGAMSVADRAFALYSGSSADPNGTSPSARSA